MRWCLAARLSFCVLRVHTDYVQGSGSKSPVCRAPGPHQLCAGHAIHFLTLTGDITKCSGRLCIACLVRKGNEDSRGARAGLRAWGQFCCREANSG